MRSKLIITFLIILVVVLAAPIIFYAWRFMSYPLSRNPTDFNAFGGYIGGVLGPVVGVANILVLIYLTIKVSNIDENRHLTNLRIAEIKELRDLLDNVPKINLIYYQKKEIQKARGEIQWTKHKVSSFSKTTRKILFKGLSKEKGESVQRSLIEIIKAYDHYMSTVKDNSDLSGTKIYAAEKYINSRIVNFNAAKDELVSELIEISLNRKV